MPFIASSSVTLRRASLDLYEGKRGGLGALEFRFPRSFSFRININQNAKAISNYWEEKLEFWTSKA